MNWNPTDKQGWERAFQTSTSPSVPPRPTKKVRIDTTNDTGEVQPVNGQDDLGTSNDAEKSDAAENAAALCELSSAEPGPMRSFFRRKIQRPPPPSVPEFTQTEVNATESSSQLPALDTRSNSKLHDVLGPSHLESNNGFSESFTPPDASASIYHPHFDQYTDVSSPNDIGDVAAMLERSVSPSLTPTSLFTPIASTPITPDAESIQTTSAFVKPQPLSSQAPTPSYGRPGFLFGNLGDGLDRGYKSDYFSMIKSNPYTTALLPCAPTPGTPIPQNATEARDLFKRGRYGQAKQDTVPQPTTEELQKVLQDLRKRYSKLKVMCDMAGIEFANDVWDRTIALVEGDRPDIERTLKKDTGKGLTEYMKQVERWDKAVGHQAILMKRLNYKQQIAVLEKKIKEAIAAAAKEARYTEWRENESEAGGEDGSEWKGHKTRLGRRFSGLIEKD